MRNIAGVDNSVIIVDTEITKSSITHIIGGIMNEYNPETLSLQGKSL